MSYADRYNEHFKNEHPCGCVDHLTWYDGAMGAYPGSKRKWTVKCNACKLKEAEDKLTSATAEYRQVVRETSERG